MKDCPKWKVPQPGELKQPEVMDLSVIHTNQDEVVEQNIKIDNNYQNHSCQTKNETDFEEKNNLLDLFKTETISNDCYNLCGFMLRGCGGYNKPNFKDDNSPFSYKSFKKAMDLSVHNRACNENKRTIFEDADYFSKNHLYKLLPITFESVDETIIHTEHNYCHLSFSSGSDCEEDCSRTLDYSQIKEKNYKKRRAKNNNVANKLKRDEEKEQVKTESPYLILTQKENNTTVAESGNLNDHQYPEHSNTPLDLSAPLVQEEKTDHYVNEHQSSFVNSPANSEKEKDDKEDSDKENQKSTLRCIEVTITRPDEKENYQPCDLFLNDIARLVPKLIEKDCTEIDILDRTCDRYIEVEKHRLYYVIAESTWHLFQSSNERVILTNDQSLGQPIQKKEKEVRPTFLIFDQYSLAKCLADYCKEIGGCFEYIRVEDEKLSVMNDEENLMESKNETKELKETMNVLKTVNELSESANNALTEVKKLSNNIAGSEVKNVEQDEKLSVTKDEEHLMESNNETKELVETMNVLKTVNELSESANNAVKEVTKVSNIKAGSEVMNVKQDEKLSVTNNEEHLIESNNETKELIETVSVLKTMNELSESENDAVKEVTKLSKIASSEGKIVNGTEKKNNLRLRKQRKYKILRLKVTKWKRLNFLLANLVNRKDKNKKFVRKAKDKKKKLQKAKSSVKSHVNSRKKDIHSSNLENIKLPTNTVFKKKVAPKEQKTVNLNELSEAKSKTNLVSEVEKKLETDNTDANKTGKAKEADVQIVKSQNENSVTLRPRKKSESVGIVKTQENPTNTKNSNSKKISAENSVADQVEALFHMSTRSKSRSLSEASNESKSNNMYKSVSNLNKRTKRKVSLPEKSEVLAKKQRHSEIPLISDGSLERRTRSGKAIGEVKLAPQVNNTKKKKITSQLAKKSSSENSIKETRQEETKSNENKKAEMKKGFNLRLRSQKNGTNLSENHKPGQKKSNKTSSKGRRR